MNVKGEPNIRQRSSSLKPPSKRHGDFDDNGGDDLSTKSTVLTFCTDNGTQTINKTIRKSIGRPIGSTRNQTRQISPRHKVKRRRVKYMDWNRFHKLDVIYSFIDELERDYPAICTVYVLGKSVEGRDIKMLKISNSDANNSPVWLDGSIHPREWVTTAAVTYIAEILAKRFKNLSKSITNKDWYIVPVLNPDGYQYSHTCDRMWRKNKALYGGDCVGVDLNRNFSYGWGHNGEEGSSEIPNNVFYRGPAPFSEPETMAVRDFILRSPNRFKVFLSFHSYYEMIIFPWGFKKDSCPDYLNLMEAGMKMAKAIYDYSGITYKVGSTKDLTYYACGTAIDWSYAVAKIPYSYMIELRSKKFRFKLPKEQIMDTCMESWEAVKSLMKYVDDPSYEMKLTVEKKKHRVP